MKMIFMSVILKSEIIIVSRALLQSLRQTGIATSCGTPEVFRSERIGKFGDSFSGTWLPLLAAVNMIATIV
jgi:hypothetical protein